MNSKLDYNLGRLKALDINLIFLVCFWREREQKRKRERGRGKATKGEHH